LIPLANKKTVRYSKKKKKTKQKKQLLNYLKDFSKNLIAKTQQLDKEVNSLVYETQSHHIKLHTAFNQFLMLSSSQFIENVLSLLILPYKKSTDPCGDRMLTACHCVESV
jgi:hypothetical protein